jgi:DNA-binding MarR family transcriptional regulator
MDDDANRRGRSIARGLLKVREWSERHLHIRNSMIRWDVLMVVASAEGGSLLYSELDARVGRSPRALQYVLRDLQSLGLIHMTKADHDRRCVRIALSDKARRRIAQLAEQMGTVAPEADAPKGAGTRAREPLPA